MNYGFIGGYGRSGTTVAMLALSKSQEVFPLMETQLFNEVVFPYLDGNNIEGFRQRYRRFVSVSADMEFGGKKSKKNPPSVTAYFSKNEQAVLSMLSASGPCDLDVNLKVRKVIDLIFGVQAHAAGKNICLEKSPRIITVAGRVVKALPEAKFIHMHRDPKDVYCSVRSKFWGPKNVPQFVKSYQDVMEKAYREMRGVPDDQYMTVQLEDLVREPEACIRAMVTFLDMGDDFIDEAVALVQAGDAHIGRWSREMMLTEAHEVFDVCEPIYEKWKKMNWRI
jgi:hypothetical protein